MAEMTPDSLMNKDTGYFLCFRPLAVRVNSPHRYACRYLCVPLEEVRLIRKDKLLTASLKKRLDSGLADLSLLAD